MTTQEVANKWAEMCRKGENLECIEQLYADDVTSKEMPGFPEAIVTGKNNVMNKSKIWLDNVEEFHKGGISNPVVAGNHFTAKMDYDVTFKEKGRMQMEEVGVFEVKDGKIINEQFFYDM
ncbi:nuclear transport factor 2 family protein [Pontimicrobium aquaticum]|uniref:Nuclear transport factor 2 family protein n=1 Tax=Pontimicrobium aquaticum TaxID=2565367 RepID=A0A4U0EVA4_9FLAO|nr:nuclear transport factor 2 family protein [Pontimicrobium aquaticum]TJY35847.1 nuclear transport factor 2 family protein [Pontimicrobium aquaticum]